jgi:hypothetical protein
VFLHARSANALNYLLYQGGWCAAIGAVLLGMPAAAAAIAAALAGVHLWLAREPREELRLVLLGGAVGLVVDSVQVAAGLISFPSGSVAAWLCPPWIVALWMQFATTFRYSLRWLVARPLSAGLAGAISGPLAYLGGERLGLVHLHEPRPLTLAVMSVLWTVALLVLARGVGAAAPGEYTRSALARAKAAVSTIGPADGSSR